MPSGVRYSETLRMQPSKFFELVGIVALSAAPLTVFSWVAWRPVGIALVVGALLVVSAAFWYARWELQVRADGLYYRLVPFYPVWRSIAAASEVTNVTADHDANGSTVLRDEGARFPWSPGNRTVAMDVQGGVRIERAVGGDAFVSSRSPDAFASALRAVAN